MRIQYDSCTISHALRLLRDLRNIHYPFSYRNSLVDEIENFLSLAEKELEASIAEVVEGDVMAVSPSLFGVVRMGHKVRCKITGFTGTIVGFAEFLDGRKQACLLPKCGEDGDFPERAWVDVINLQRLDKEDTPLGFGEGSK